MKLLFRGDFHASWVAWKAMDIFEQVFCLLISSTWHPDHFISEKGLYNIHGQSMWDYGTLLGYPSHGFIYPLLFVPTVPGSSGNGKNEEDTFMATPYPHPTV